MKHEHATAPAAAGATDQPWSIERHGIDPIPVAERHGTPGELFKMWLGANINYVVVVTGAVVLAQGLSVLQAFAAILVGNILGCAVLGLTTIMGPRTGSSGIMTSRACFGQLGAFLPMLVSLVSALSWFSIASVVATQSMQELFRMAGLEGPLMVWIALAVVLAAEILIALFGHATIIAAEKWIALALGILFFGLACFVVPHVQLAEVLSATTGGGSFATWLVAVGVVAAYPIGWANFASDYSRYFPQDTDWKRIALSAGGGQFLALTFCEVIGVLFALALHGSLGDDPISQLRPFLPAWFMVPFLFAIVLGGVAANVPNGYTASLGLLAMRLPISRVRSLAVIVLFTIGFRIATVFYGQFYQMYQEFLDYMTFWTAPWAAIVVVDYFLRRGRYNAVDLMRWGGGEYWYQGGVAWRGVLAFVFGTGMSVLFCNSPSYASPLMTVYLHSMDLSVEAGFLLTAALYYGLARRTPAPATLSAQAGA